MPHATLPRLMTTLLILGLLAGCAGRAPTPDGERAAGQWEDQAERLERLDRMRAAAEDHGARAAESLGLRIVPVRDQMRLQLVLLDEGLRTVERYGEAPAPEPARLSG